MNSTRLWGARLLRRRLLLPLLLLTSLRGPDGVRAHTHTPTPPLQPANISAAIIVLTHSRISAFRKTLRALAVAESFSAPSPIRLPLYVSVDDGSKAQR